MYVFYVKEKKLFYKSKVLLHVFKLYQKWKADISAQGIFRKTHKADISALRY